MGHWASRYYTDPDFSPDHHNPPVHHQDLGFPGKRKERVMIATPEEMDSARLLHSERDYCAHLLIDMLACKRRVWPLCYKCKHERHNYATCQHNDYYMRMREYEREKRLLQRRKRTQSLAGQGNVELLTE